LDDDLFGARLGFDLSPDLIPVSGCHFATPGMGAVVLVNPTGFCLRHDVGFFCDSILSADKGIKP
jgi:hypothetical protein